MQNYLKQPCNKCPFRKDVTPFLHPDRAAQIAYATYNPFTEFPCHKTTVLDEDSEDGDMMVVETSKLCAGFLTMQAQAGIDVPKGFEPSTDCYEDDLQMIDAYTNEWTKTKFI